MLETVRAGGFDTLAHFDLPKRYHRIAVPDKEILQRYAQLGGTMITVGSDAHCPEDVGAGFDYVQDLLHDFPQFQVGYFEQRHFISYQSQTSD